LGTTPTAIRPRLDGERDHELKQAGARPRLRLDASLGEHLATVLEYDNVTWLDVRSRGTRRGRDGSSRGVKRALSWVRS
jgi:hypothetical protein